MTAAWAPSKARINASAPFGGIPMYVYMSKDDWIITNCQTNDFAANFLRPTRATKSGGGHYPGDFDGALVFLKANHTDGSFTPPAPAPDELPDAGCESSTSILLRLYWWIIPVSLICCCGACYSCALCCCRDKIPARCRCDWKKAPCQRGVGADKDGSSAAGMSEASVKRPQRIL